MLYIFTYMMCIPYSHDILSSNAFSFVPIAFLSINLIEYLDQMNRFLSALDCIGFVVALPTWKYDWHSTWDCQSDASRDIPCALLCQGRQSVCHRYSGQWVRSDGETEWWAPSPLFDCVVELFMIRGTLGAGENRVPTRIIILLIETRAYGLCVGPFWVNAGSFMAAGHRELANVHTSGRDRGSQKL